MQGVDELANFNSEANLTSLQILILKATLSFSFSTVNVLFKPHNTRTCPTTVFTCSNSKW